jgi:sec-independent protein translocase protein TatA
MPFDITFGARSCQQRSDSGQEELPIILLIFVVLSGAFKLPEPGQALGKGIGNFQRALSDEDAISWSLQGP